MCYVRLVTMNDQVPTLVYKILQQRVTQASRDVHTGDTNNDIYGPKTDKICNFPYNFYVCQLIWISWQNQSLNLLNLRWLLREKPV